MVKMRLYLPRAVLIILIMKDTLAEADADPEANPEFAINQILKRSGGGKGTKKPTTKKPTTTLTPPPTTTTPYVQTDTTVSTKATLQEPYNPKYADPNSAERKAFDTKMENAMDDTLKDTVDGYKGYEVTNVSPGPTRRKRSTGSTVVEGKITLDTNEAKPGAAEKIKNSGAELGKALNTTVSVEAKYECKYDGKVYQTGDKWTGNGDSCSCSNDGKITCVATTTTKPTEKPTTKPDDITTQPTTTTTTEATPETPSSQPPKEKIYFH